MSALPLSETTAHDGVSDTTERLPRHAVVVDGGTPYVKTAHEPALEPSAQDAPDAF